MKHGGATNRPGTQFVAEVKDSTKATRLIPFIFNSDQTYVLEVGEEYIRFFRNSFFAVDLAKTFVGITNTNPAVAEVTTHDLTTGEEIYITDVLGMTEVNNRSFKVNVLTADTFELLNMDGTDFDASGLSVGTSGGYAVVYEVATNYTEDELFELQNIQSADVITVTHQNHPPAELTRVEDNEWEYEELTFAPTIAQPEDLAASGPTGSTVYDYVVTAVAIDTYEESLPGKIASTLTITGITQANPPVITTSASHGLSNGHQVYLDAIVGMTELNGGLFIITVVSTTKFSLNKIDATGYGAYTSGGTATKAFIKISAGTLTEADPNVITWDAVSDAVEYNIYKRINGIYGLIGIAGTNSFNDINIEPDTSATPPVFRNPFLGTGNYPSTVTYIQQRLAFANTVNDPEKVIMSRTGNFKNFTTSNPIQEDDSVSFNMVGRQVNRVKHLIDLGKLVILTSGGEFSANGNESGVITPTSVNTKQYSYNGSADLPPIIVNGAALYLQARGSIIRDLGFDFQIDGYRGNDLTIFSSHLFDKYTIVDWAYQSIPHSIIWAVRDDGVLLGLTYVREQQMLAWHKHDFQGGRVKSITVIPEGNEDFLYLIIERTINGVVKKYIEKLSSRKLTDIKDSIFMDSALSYDGRNTTAKTMTLTGGSTWAYDEDLTLTSSDSFFTSADVGNQIHFDDDLRLSIKSYTSATVVTVRSNKTVPVAHRGVATASWSRAVDVVTGLWHLEGEDVSVLADGLVAASPNNSSYDTVTVENGSITLDRPYSVIHVGLPYLSDLETLDIETVNSETLINKKILIQGVDLFVEESRGLWAGARAPSDSAPLEGLKEYVQRSNENYSDPIALLTDKMSVTVESRWNSNGRVFVRQVDPLPATILAIAPSGYIPQR